MCMQKRRKDKFELFKMVYGKKLKRLKRKAEIKWYEFAHWSLGILYRRWTTNYYAQVPADVYFYLYDYWITLSVIDKYDPKEAFRLRRAVAKRVADIGYGSADIAYLAVEFLNLKSQTVAFSIYQYAQRHVFTRLKMHQLPKDMDRKFRRLGVKLCKIADGYFD